MHTRSKGQPLELFDPVIEASNRRRNAQRRLNQRIRASSPIQGRPLSPVKRELSPTPFEITMADNGENNASHPDPVVQQLQLELANLVKQVKEQDEKQATVPVQNMYAYRGVENPPIGNDQINANTFELRTGLLNMAEANEFGEKTNEDPNKHLTKFIQISNKVKLNGVTYEQIRLRLFPFSLKDDARDWYDSMGAGSIRTWDAMVNLFLEKYFPPSEALKRQAEIIQFQMKPHETIREARARFKKLLKRCPNHGLSPGHQVITFYRGCISDAMRELNWSAGGTLLHLGEDDAMQVIERVASNGEG